MTTRKTEDIIAQLSRDARTVYVHSDAPERKRIADNMTDAAKHMKALLGLLGVALTGLDAGERHYNLDDMYRLNVEAGLEELGLDPQMVRRMAGEGDDNGT